MGAMVPGDNLRLHVPSTLVHIILLDTLHLPHLSSELTWSDFHFAPPSTRSLGYHNTSVWTDESLGGCGKKVRTLV